MKIRMIIIVLITLLIGGVIGHMLPQKNNSEQSIISSTKSSLDTSKYELLVNRIQKEFTMEGYKEILGENSDIVVVPDIIAGQQDIPEGLYLRNKKFIYKNSNNGMIIILSISASEKRVDRFWDHSINYAKENYNSETGIYKDTYDSIFPDSEVSIYDFRGDGYSLSIVGISDNPLNEDVFTLSQTAQFLQELEKYLN
ncbi:hypothetical protein SLU01_35590 [Sporosarcina luteola]|uniref:Uncharacterized protein n=1 Tax=Sporosarcina luteola TaxID=582850 RepID=A0A511ZCR7_9BACL|nr:hypothetical protein [Sporosarcina luteola]GEN85247.1 hypothetical protein SLU01_35590 [Sporosarcina luteola]